MHKLFQILNTTYHPKLINAMIKANFSGAVIVNLLLPVIIFYLFYNFIPLVHLKIWVGLQISVFFLRIIFQKMIMKNINIHLFLLSATSLLYAVLPWQALFYSDHIHLLLVAMIIASIVAGSIATIVSVYHIFFIFVLIQMIGLISAFLYVNQDIFYLSAIMATSFLHLVLTNGYKQYQNIKKTLKLNEQVNNLLNNIGEGFLSFDADLICQSSFSSECVRILNSDQIEGTKITELLFHNNREKKELFEEGIKRSVTSNDAEMTELFLSLLPKEHIINDNEVSLEVKQLKKGYFMLIIKDITYTNRLKLKLEYQNQVQQLLINVASNKNDFIDLKNDFEKLVHTFYTQKDNSLHSIENIKKELHTFKGNFSQKGMIYISNYIHELELKIRNLSSNEEVIRTCLDANLQEIFNKDIAVIDLALGKEFLSSTNSISVEVNDIDDIEFSLKSFVYKFNLEQQIALNTILSDIHKLKNIPIMSLLNPYIIYVEQISKKLGKEITPLKITGDSSLKISPRLKPFMKQLVHLFNNAIDHGIDSVGTITCNFSINTTILVLKISDDGEGIDTKKVTQIALEKALITQSQLSKMSEEEICYLIFKDRLSTKQSVTSISGIGIGLSSLKNELDKLGGKVFIENKKNQGVSFTFYIPLFDNKNVNLFYNHSQTTHCENIITTLITQSELFIKRAIGSIVSSNHNLEISDTNLYLSQINLSNGFNGTIIMIFCENILEAFTEYLLPEGYEEFEKGEVLQDVADETINTIVGLSLQYLDKDIKEVEISPPIPQHLENLFSIMHSQEKKSVATVETQRGTLGIIVLSKGI